MIQLKTVSNLFWMKVLFSVCIALSALSISKTTHAQTIDALILYSDGVEQRYGSSIDTRIQQVISVTNKVFSDSDLDISLRAVHTANVNISDSESSESILYDLTCDFDVLQTNGQCNRGSSFSNVSALRAQYGADMVIVYRPYQSSHGGVCGIAWIGGNQTNGDFSNPFWKETAMSVVSLDGPCGDWVTSHELGHNMGLNHGSLQDNSGGTFGWAWGYGESNNFATIMAYDFVYGFSTQKIYNFSSPNLSCNGRPCGINRSLSNGADAVHTLGITAPQVANFTATVVNEEADNSEQDAEIEALRLSWLEEQETFNSLLENYESDSQARLTIRTQFNEARETYSEAYQDYSEKREEFSRLTLVANRAILAYNDSVSEDAATRAQLLETVNLHLAARDASAEVATAALALVNNLTPTYQAAFSDHANALENLITSRSAMLAQQNVMNEARRLYDEALAAS